MSWPCVGSDGVLDSSASWSLQSWLLLWRWVVWFTTLKGERPIPDNLVAGGGVRQQFFRETLSGVTGLAVSVEAAGGAQQPTPSTIQTVTELTS
jgi:hypothetical protein